MSSTPEPWEPEELGSTSRWDRLRRLMDIDSQIQHGNLQSTRKSEQSAIDRAVAWETRNTDWSLGGMITRSIIKGHKDAAWEWSLIRGSWLAGDVPPGTPNN